MNPNLSDCRGLLAFGDVAADTRKMPFRYSLLCGTASDAVDAVTLQRRIKIGNPGGFQTYKIKTDAITEKKTNAIFEIETLNLD